MKKLHILHPCWHFLPWGSGNSLAKLEQVRDDQETVISITDAEWLILNIQHPDLQNLPTEVGNIWIENYDTSNTTKKAAQ